MTRNNKKNFRKAVERKDTEKIKKLLKKPFITTYATIYSLRNKNIELLKLLIEEFLIDPIELLKKIINKETENGSEEIIDLLYNNINLVDWDYNIDLSVASKNGHLQIVKLLLKIPDIDINIYNWNFWPHQTPIEEASRNGHIKIVKLLLEFPSIKLNNSLHAATANNHIEVVKLLLKYSIKYIDNALHTAIYNNYANIVKLLIDSGAELTGFNNIQNMSIEIELVLLRYPNIRPLINNSEKIFEEFRTIIKIMYEVLPTDITINIMEYTNCPLSVMEMLDV